ncbi:MAG: cupin domain-containing protein [Acidobacteriota bacterium]
MIVRQSKIQEKEGRTGHESLAGHLSAPRLDFNLPKEIAELHEEEAWVRTGRNSKTLVKQPDLRIVLMAFEEGAQLTGHSTDARMSIYTLMGHVKLIIPGQTIDLPQGQLLVLDRGVEHALEALEESAILLTISWPHHPETA